MSVKHKNFKKCKNQKQNSNKKSSLSSFLVFKENENKFQIDYQKILRFRDNHCL